MKRKQKIVELTISDFIKEDDFPEIIKDATNGATASSNDEIIYAVFNAGKNIFDLSSYITQFFLISKIKGASESQINAISAAIKKSILRVIANLFQVYYYFGGDIINHELDLSIQIATDLIEYLRFQVQVDDIEQAYYNIVSLESKKKAYTWASLTDVERKVAILRYYFGVTTIDELWKVIYEL